MSGKNLLKKALISWKLYLTGREYTKLEDVSKSVSTVKRVATQVKVYHNLMLWMLCGFVIILKTYFSHGHTISWICGSTLQWGETVGIPWEKTKWYIHIHPTDSPCNYTHLIYSVLACNHWIRNTDQLYVHHWQNKYIMNTFLPMSIFIAATEERLQINTHVQNSLQQQLFMVYFCWIVRLPNP